MDRSSVGLRYFPECDSNATLLQLYFKLLVFLFSPFWLLWCSFYTTLQQNYNTDEWGMGSEKHDICCKMLPSRIAWDSTDRLPEVHRTFLQPSRKWGLCNCYSRVMSGFHSSHCSRFSILRCGPQLLQCCCCGSSRHSMFSEFPLYYYPNDCVVTLVKYVCLYTLTHRGGSLFDTVVVFSC